MTRDVPVFVKCNTIFRLFFFGNYYKFELITFARQCDNTVKVWWEVFYGFVGNLLLLPAVKEF